MMTPEPLALQASKAAVTAKRRPHGRAASLSDSAIARCAAPLVVRIGVEVCRQKGLSRSRGWPGAARSCESWALNLPQSRKDPAAKTQNPR